MPAAAIHGRRIRRSSPRVRERTTVPPLVALASRAMAGAATSQPTPQRLAAIREQLSLLADYL